MCSSQCKCVVQLLAIFRCVTRIILMIVTAFVSLPFKNVPLSRIWLLPDLLKYVFFNIKHGDAVLTTQRPLAPRLRIRWRYTCATSVPAEACHGVTFILNVKTASCVISNKEWMTLFTVNTTLLLILITTINNKVAMTGE